MLKTQSIDWVRWLFYLLGGIPVFVWLFAVRDRTLRLVGVLGLAFFVEDVLAGRRYFWAFSLSPSLAGAYVGLLAVMVERRRMPQPGVYGAIWAGLLLSAAIGVIAGSGGGLFAVNVKYFQLGYLNGFFFFLFGLIALETSREFKRFWEWFILFSLLMAVAHLFSLATGYRFRAETETTAMAYGGVLGNTNTLGSYYAMAIPPVLSLLMTRALEPRMRTLAWVTLAAMAGSLVLTGCRTAYLFTPVLVGLALVQAGVPLGRAIAMGLLTFLAGGLGFLAMSSLASDAWRVVSEELVAQGTRTDRLATFAGFVQVLLEHPFGIGLSPENARGLIERYTHRGVLSSHNIYLDMAVQIGIPGLLVFLWLTAQLLLGNRRAARLSTDPVERQALFCTYLALLGFFLCGIFQPIYTASVGSKMNNLFWLLSGLNAGAVNRVLAARRLELEAERTAQDAVPLPTAHARRA